MNKSNNLILLTTYCLVILATRAQEEKTITSALRGSEKQRSLQGENEDDCSYEGGYGWYNCQSTKYHCADGYTCEPHPTSWIGVRCVKQDCVTNRIGGGIGPIGGGLGPIGGGLGPIGGGTGPIGGGTGPIGGDTGPIGDTEIYEPSEPDQCWHGDCSVGEACGLGLQCMQKSESLCACYDPLNTPSCLQGFGESAQYSLCASGVTVAPTESPTITPTGYPTKSPIISSSSSKSSKDNRRRAVRHLSHVTEMEGNIPLQRLR